MSGMSRSITLGALVLAVAVGFAHVARQSPLQAQSRPNIVLIQADDLGYGDLSAYGQAQFATPGLDRLAREGIRFTSYYAGSTVCAPSRAALMTGLHTGHGWIRGNGDIPLREEDVTVAMLLRDAGYRTAVIGKWGLGTPGTPGQPDRKGFDYAFGFLDHRHAHRQFTDHLYRNAERVPTDLAGDYVNDLFTQEAEAFITRQDPKPFFLYLNYTVPHAELRAPEDSMAPHRGRFPEAPFTNAEADARPAGATIEGRSLGYRSQPTPRAAFVAMITRMDRDIARLTTRLGELKLDERTLIMFVSDNGPHREGGADPAFFKSAGGLRGIKRDLYEGGIRVPMIARWRGTIPAGRVSDHVWAHWDMLPTLSELAGAKTPPALDGLSMARALKGQPQQTHDFLYLGVPRARIPAGGARGTLEGRPAGQGGAARALRPANDPHEERDVAAGNRDVVAKIEQYLQSARTESARWPVK